MVGLTERRKRKVDHDRRRRAASGRGAGDLAQTSGTLDDGGALRARGARPAQERGVRRDVPRRVDARHERPRRDGRSAPAAALARRRRDHGPRDARRDRGRQEDGRGGRDPETVGAHALPSGDRAPARERDDEKALSAPRRRVISVIGVSVRALATCIALGVCLGPGLAVAESLPIAPQFGAPSAQDPQQLQLPLRAPMTLLPSITISEEFNDNVLLDNRNRRWDLITGVTPALNAFNTQNFNLDGMWRLTERLSAWSSY